MYPQEVWVW